MQNDFSGVRMDLYILKMIELKAQEFNTSKSAIVRSAVMHFLELDINKQSEIIKKKESQHKRLKLERKLKNINDKLTH
jgi:hypothetical protein